MAAPAELEHADWKTVVLDERTGQPAVPNGSVGHRYAASDEGSWNLKLEGIEPVLTLIDRATERVPVDLPRFDVGEGEGGGIVRRGVPAIRVGGKLVTTVLDLVLAQYGVARPGLPGEWPSGYDDAADAGHAGVAGADHGVDRRLVAKVAREFARNAEVTEGRSMICMGAGTNHWFHSDQVYRTFLALVMLCGCEGRNGGGWAHYVGQEKVRPLTGLQTVAFALDWTRPPRHQSSTPFFYLATDQWRYERIQPEHLASPLGQGLLDGRHIADVNALGARLGWLPSFPSFDRSTHEIVAEAEAEGIAPAEYVVRELREGRLAVRVRGPGRAAQPSEGDDGVAREPARLLGQGSRVLPQASDRHDRERGARRGVPARAAPQGRRLARAGARGEARSDDDDRLPDDLERAVLGRRAARGDVVREVRPLLDGSASVRARVQRGDRAAVGGEVRLGGVSPHRQGVLALWPSATSASGRISSRRRCSTTPRRDRPAARARSATGRPASASPIPGRTMPKLIVVERDYPHVAERWAALGPLLETLGSQVKGASWKPLHEIEELGAKNGAVRGGIADGRPSLERVEYACEAILALSGTTNGRLAVEGFRSLEARTGVKLTRSRVGAGGGSDRVQGRADAAADGDHLAGVVGDRVPRPAVLAVHDQHRAREAVAHPLGPPALLSRPSVDARARRGAAGVPPAASSPRDLRRSGQRRRLRPRGADAAST